MCYIIFFPVALFGHAVLLALFNKIVLEIKNGGIWKHLSANITIKFVSCLPGIPAIKSVIQKKSLLSNTF